MNVKNIISTRFLEKSNPGVRNDEYKLGLVIEGGGMKGVITGGMAAALERTGYVSCFDTIYGASSGAMAGAFLASGSASKGATVYYEHINNRQFISPSRLFSKKPILNLEYLIKGVFKDKVPLDYVKLSKSKVPFKCIATNAKTGKPVLFSNFRDSDHLDLALIATACNPIASGGPISIDGVMYWDACLSETIPIKSALLDGCTHALVLRSKVQGSLPPVPNVLLRWMAKKHILPYSLESFNQFCTDYLMYEDELNTIDELGQSCESILPLNDCEVDLLTIDRQKLYNAAIEGYCSVLRYFNDRSGYVGSSIDHY